jgi:hypothetical protein
MISISLNFFDLIDSELQTCILWSFHFETEGTSGSTSFAVFAEGAGIMEGCS